MPSVTKKQKNIDTQDSNHTGPNIKSSFESSPGIRTSAQKSVYQHVNGMNRIQTLPQKMSDQHTKDNNASLEESFDSSSSHGRISNKRKRTTRTREITVKEKDYVSNESKNKGCQNYTYSKSVNRSLNFSAKNNVDDTAKESPEQHLDGDNALVNKNRVSSKHSKKGKTQNNPKKSQKVRKNKNKVEDNLEEPQQLRRSTRHAGPPLAFWRSEYKRFLYDPKAVDVIFKGINGNKEEKNFFNGIRIQLRKTPKSKKKQAKAFDGDIVVKVPISGETVKLPLSRSFLDLEWTSNNTENPAYQMTKTFQSDSETTSYGFLNILAKQAKPFQYSPSDNTLFVVLKGSVEAIIHKTARIYERNDSFFVPHQTAYMIKNQESVNALLSYCTSKEPFFSDIYK